MLFIFERSGRYGFWMKEMRFAIDIVWIGEDLRIVHIAADVTPETYPEVFKPPEAARYVLEMPAMSMREMGARPGTTVTLPAPLRP